MSDPLLSLRDVGRSFGALAAVDGVDLDVAAGTLHALIGPNGAGKTTLVNLIDGALKADRGQIRFAGRPIVHLPDHARARLGLARTYQITSIFPASSVRDNVLVAVVAASGRTWRMWRPMVRDTAACDRAMALLADVGLAEHAERPAGTLAHGQQRQLEIAMALAAAPRLLLLDEPMAGMGPEESADMVERLRDLKTRHTILLVEHDMDAVFALADVVTVLVSGRVLMTGAPDDVRTDEGVRQAYLGTGEDAA
ncbi:MAG: ABC transporter ATP-binding protein [Rhodospirillaceae bacterium]|nr:ABC transporter ATP-binding protein [Rhodospirillaceae bacterium]MCA8932468.1 ABC transporter ATP-binding protein [Rhodospirillaceae bacterium]